jgi:HAD superfamily hydrolase (TIGR01509 family)
VIRGLLFDFDGLLVDTESPARLVWEELYREHGFELPRERWAGNIGTLDEPFDPLRHLEGLVGPGFSRTALDERRRAREWELVALERFRPGVEEYLAEAKRRGLLTGIVSSSWRWWIDPILERLERSHGWDAIVVADGDVARAKPRPTLYLEALRELGLRADEAIAFEDSPNGVRAATSAGVFCVAVPNPITATLAFENADLVLSSLAELPLGELLERVEHR